jgi:hypothetical protein
MRLSTYICFKRFESQNFCPFQRHSDGTVLPPWFSFTSKRPFAENKWHFLVKLQAPATPLDLNTIALSMNPPPTGGDNSRGSALGAAEAASSEPPARPADDGASPSLSSMPTARASNIVGPSGTTCDQQIPPRRTVVDWVQLYQSGHERRLAEARRQL